MKTFFREYFYVPKNGRIKDQVMMAHVIFTTVFILLCLLAMVVTAYSHAMFNLEVESKKNVIASASFDAEYYVEYEEALISPTAIEEGEVVSEEPVDIEFVEADDHVYEVTFDTPGIYRVEVTALGTAQNGFCVFEVACDDPDYDAVYYTPSMSAYDSALSELHIYFAVTTPATVTATSYLGSVFDYEEFGEIAKILLVDGYEIPIGEQPEISEEDMIDDPELMEELFGEDAFLVGELEEDDSDSFGGSGGGGGFTSSDDFDENDSSFGDEETGNDNGFSSDSGDSDNGSDSAPSGGSDSGSSSAPSGGSDSGSSSAPSGGSDGGSSSAPSGGSDGGGSSAPSGGSDSGSSSAPSGGSDGGSSSAPSGGGSSAPSGGSDSGSSSGGGDSAPAGE